MPYNAQLPRPFSHVACNMQLLLHVSTLHAPFFSMQRLLHLIPNIWDLAYNLVDNVVAYQYLPQQVEPCPQGP